MIADADGEEVRCRRSTHLGIEGVKVLPSVQSAKLPRASCSPGMICGPRLPSAARYCRLFARSVAGGR